MKDMRMGEDESTVSIKLNLRGAVYARKAKT
jgi:hypothetical protein